jgi:hypothetical protein
MYKALLIVGAFVILSACKSSKAKCDAYGDNCKPKKETKIA